VRIVCEDDERTRHGASAMRRRSGDNAAISIVVVWQAYHQYYCYAASPSPTRKVWCLHSPTLVFGLLLSVSSDDLYTASQSTACLILSTVEATVRSARTGDKDLMEKIPFRFGLIHRAVVVEGALCCLRSLTRKNRYITHKPDSVVLLGYNERYEAWFLHAVSLVKAWACLCRRNLILC